MNAYKVYVEKVHTITATYLIEAKSEDEAREIISVKDQDGLIDTNNIGTDDHLYDDRLGNESGSFEVTSEDVSIEEITELEKEVA
jgi:hypothetical protein|tara:strand:+ start:526 stop:780 length:255 start_codon:yes stop_codon:yes gene_type:complete